MNGILTRVDDNEWYVLYKSKLEKNDVGNKYSIYRTKDWGNDLLGSFRYLKEAREVFNKATREAIEHSSIMNES